MSLQRKIQVADHKILAMASAKEDGARCTYNPDGTIVCEAWGKEPKVLMAVGERELPLLVNLPSVHYPEALKVKGGEPATPRIPDRSSYCNQPDDPILIAKKIDVFSKKPFSKPAIAQAPSGHKGWRVIAHNGIAHADEGTVIQG